ncbi:ANK-REP-REGION domain-containing protein [Aphelenchoides fujianensis]|nr:ANK-REP-REGION domain-containing protein [Aphelenchoides fujianensis]
MMPPTSQPPIPPLGSAVNSATLLEILDLPMPERMDAEFQQMDPWTAASLNIEMEDEKAGSAADFSRTNHAGWTPLMYAAYLGHSKTMQRLIQRGVQVEQQNEKGQTALMLAASCGSEEILALFLNHPFDTNVRDKDGRSALHYAALYGQGKWSRLLLESNFDPNALDKDRMTPTLMACASGQIDVLKQMLKFDGNPALRNASGQNGEELGAANDQPAVAQFFRRERQKEMDELKRIFEEKDLSKYLPQFKEHNLLSLNAFMQLNGEKLDQLGITLLGPRKKIEGIVAGLKQAKAAARARRESGGAHVERRAKTPLAPVAPPIPARGETPIDYKRLCNDYAAKLEATEKKLEAEQPRIAHLENILSAQFQFNSNVIQSLKALVKSPANTPAVAQQIAGELDKANQRILSALRR